MEYFDDRTVQEQKQEYAEYRDVVQPEKSQDTAPAPEPVSIQDGQQTQMMKMFADDVGKIMGEMINKIESMNNTIFTLQNDINTVLY